MKYKGTLITTSKKTSDEARRMAKLFRHVIPDSSYINRGKRSLSSIISMAQEKSIKHLIILTSKGNAVNHVNFYDYVNGGYEHLDLFLRVFEFIDHKIFNQKKLYHRGPLSTSLETRSEDPELIDLLQKYFKITYGNKEKLWLLLDKKEFSSYIAFVDSTTMQRFSMIKLQVKKRT